MIGLHEPTDSELTEIGKNIENSHFKNDENEHATNEEILRRDLEVRKYSIIIIFWVHFTVVGKS